MVEICENGSLSCGRVDEATFAVTVIVPLFLGLLLHMFRKNDSSGNNLFTAIWVTMKGGGGGDGGGGDRLVEIDGIELTTDIVAGSSNSGTTLGASSPSDSSSSFAITMNSSRNYVGKDSNQKLSQNNLRNLHFYCPRIEKQELVILLKQIIKF